MNTERWSNWSGSAVCTPSTWARPKDEAELQALLRGGTGEVRPTGSGHSFMPVVPTDGTLVDVSALRGVVSVDREKAQATVWAGTTLREVTRLLLAEGLGLQNQGDIDHQTVAGAVSTGTHGTGETLGCVSTQMIAGRLVTPQGEVVELSPGSEALRLGRVTLGSLGVLSQVTLQCVPAYRLQEVVEIHDSATLMARIDQAATTHRHAELFVFPSADVGLLKTLHPTTEPGGLTEMGNGWLDDAFLWSAAATSSFKAGHWYQRTMVKLLGAQKRRGPSHVIFPAERRVRFEEMEYVLPREQGLEAFAEVLAVVRREFPDVSIPLEYRVVAADDIPLSPFVGRASAAIAVHHRPNRDWRGLLARVEPLLAARGGRPHWGKRHTLDARALAERYPEWSTYQALRRELDPRGRMLSPTLRRIFEP